MLFAPHRPILSDNTKNIFKTSKIKKGHTHEDEKKMFNIKNIIHFNILTY